MGARRPGVPSGAFSGAPIARFTGAPGANGARKSTIRAGRRRRQFRGNSVHESPDFGPTRQSGVSEDIFGRNRTGGFRDPAKKSRGGLKFSGGACPGAPIARFRGGSGRKRGPEIDHPRRPPGAPVSGQFCSHVARFRADASVWGLGRHFRRESDWRISGSRLEVLGGGLGVSGSAFPGAPIARFRGGSG